MRLAKPVWDRKRAIWQIPIAERHVLREIMDRLWLDARIRVWQIRERIPGKGRLSTPGLPDLFGYVDLKSATRPETQRISIIQPINAQDIKQLAKSQVWALPLYIEVKRPKGVRRPAQVRFIEDAKAAGCCAFFAESWADVVREMGDFGIDLRP